MRFKNYFLLLLAVLAGCIGQVQAQRCGTDLAHQHLMQTNPSYARIVQQHKADWAQYNQATSNGLITNTSNGVVYEIPVVVHVMHANAALGSINNPTDAVIVTYIDYLNKVYAAQWAAYVDTLNGGVRIPIKFVLAKRAPSASCGGAATNGINRVNVSAIYPNYTANGINRSSSAGVDDSVLKSLSIWPNSDYYNIWMVNYIDGPSGGVGGYAYYPGAPAAVDGTVILAQYATPTGGNYYYAVPHELGHAFGLPHTFEGDGGGFFCPDNTNCAIDGDGVCDTEPHINLNNSVCASGINPCTGLLYNNVQYNFMNYTACPNRFTAGQRTKVLFNLINYRPGLLYSLGTTPPAAATPPTSACIPTISASNAGNNVDAGPNEIYLTNNIGTTILANSSQGYSGDGYKAYIDRTCAMMPASLTVGGAYTLDVTTFVNAQNVRAYIDYNNDGVFAAGEQILLHTGTQANETHTAGFVVPATGVTLNTTLRMRVLADIGSSIQPCMTFNYGQAEDYPVTIAGSAHSVTIAAAPGNTVCAGASVTFTATVLNATSPSYQWKRNGVNVGANSATFTTTTLLNNDVITCEVTANAATAISNAITMVVNANVVPSVSITANPAGAVCAGTLVTYTAVPANGGSTPGYQWSVNSLNSPGAVNSTFTTTAGTLVGVTLTSNAACATPITATASTTTTINPTLVPSIAITANPGTNICSGTSVTFTATPVNGGTAPAYQWKKNGVNVGSNAATYTNATLANADVITCVLTSNGLCASPATATSNALTMTVTTAATPSVSIVANPGNSVCPNATVTFTATPTNGGTAPSYQWKINGVNVGTNLNTYTATNLLNGQVVTCVLTSSLSCVTGATATSNAITMLVSSALVPAVSIAAVPGTAICPGTSVTFTATPTNGGTPPNYQWKLNGVNVGTNAPTYTNAALTTGNVVTCVMTSSLACASPATVTSNALTMAVSSSIVPSVAITSNPGNAICTGTPVTFTAVPTNGGSTPVYQWKVNGVNVGANSTTYTNASLANADIVTCVMASSATCALPVTATSNAVTMAVSAPVAPTIAITANPGTTICAGTSVTFTAATTNGGSTPGYQWKLNGVNVGTNSPAYTNTSLASGNVVGCVLTSNAACVSATTATSNTLNMTVNTAAVPSVTVTANPAGPICAGTTVTFTAAPVNGGTNPTLNWFRNGVSVLANSPTYTTSTLTNGTTISVLMTSNASCLTTSTAGSNVITMAVNPTVSPSIGITANQSTTICSGASLTFTAATVNGGVSPAFQWKVNGSNVGINAATYTSNSWANNDIVTCVLTSSAACPVPAAATSNSIGVQVVTASNPSVSVAVTPADTICAGTLVSFVATPGNGGPSPTYYWQKNGLAVGNATDRYTDAALHDSDIVTVVMTSNAPCALRPTAFGNITVVRVRALPMPVIVASGNVLGTTGSYLVYQWHLSGVPIPGATNSTYTATGNGTYSVTVLDANGCSNTSTDFVYLSGVGVVSVGGGKSVSCYPNPASQMLYIDAKEAVNVAIYSMEGKLVLNAHLVRKIDIGQLADGLYMIQIRDQEHQLLKTDKFTKATR